MYLGDVDGRVTVYAPDLPDRGTYRIPQDDVVVRILHGADCVGGSPYRRS